MGERGATSEPHILCYVTRRAISEESATWRSVFQYFFNIESFYSLLFSNLRAMSNCSRQNYECCTQDLD